MPLLLIFLFLCWSNASAGYGEVMRVESALLSFETRLEGSQPWITQYQAFPSNIGDQEPHLPLFLVSGYAEVDVSSDTSRLILGIINIEQSLWFIQ